MYKDHVLFLVIGLLGGFLLGYVSHEVMASRQPAPAQVVATNPPASAALPANGAGSSSGPAMEQVQKLRAYVEKNPNDAQAVRELANLNFDISNWQRASELYQQYLGLAPDDPDVMTDLSACLRNLGKPAEALAILQRAKQVAPKHWQARYNEILILGIDLGRLDEASVAAIELKKLEPTNQDVSRLAEEIERRRGAGA